LKEFFPFSLLEFLERNYTKFRRKKEEGKD